MKAGGERHFKKLDQVSGFERKNVTGNQNIWLKKAGEGSISKEKVNVI